MRAGKLNRRVTIQQQSTVQDTFGAQQTSWSDVLTTNASIKPITGREFYLAQQVHSEATTEIRVRYRSGVDVRTKMRIVHGSNTYNILNVANIEDRNREIVLICSEVI